MCADTLVCSHRCFSKLPRLLTCSVGNKDLQVSNVPFPNQLPQCLQYAAASSSNSGCRQSEGRVVMPAGHPYPSMEKGTDSIHGLISTGLHSVI